MPDDNDDPAESIGAPFNLEPDSLDDGADADQDQDDSADPAPPGLDGGSSQPDTGFSSGH